MRSVITMASVLALAGSLMAQEPRTTGQPAAKATGSTTTLALNLQQGQTFEFRVQANDPHSATKLGQPGIDDHKGAGHDAKQGERDETPAGARGDTPTGKMGADKPRLGAKDATIGATKTCHFSLSVIDAASNGNATVEVRVREDASGIAKLGDKDIAAAGAKGSKTYTASINRDGQILNLSESMAARTEPGRTGKDDEDGMGASGSKEMGDRAHPAMGHDALEIDKVRCALSAIFGAGIHNVELRPGQVYVISDEVNTARAGATPGDRPERPVGDAERADRSASKSGLGAEDKTVRLRFENVDAGTARLARFSVLAPKAGIGALPGRDDRKEPGREPTPKDPTKAGDDPSRNIDPTTRTDRAAGDADRGLGAKDKGICGQATYRIEDGLLEELTINNEAGKKPGIGETGKPTDTTGDLGVQSGARAGMPTWVNIRRVSSLGLPGIDRK